MLEDDALCRRIGRPGSARWLAIREFYLSFQIGLANVVCPSCARKSLVSVRELASAGETICQNCGYPIAVADIERKDPELAKVLSLVRTLRI
jgi:hypothetical protein